MPEPVFYVRNVPVYGDAILAPMDGYSDWPFRSLCHSLGSAMSYTEFVKAEHVIRSFRHVKAKLTYEDAERPVVFQLYGDDADEMLEAAKIVQDLGPDIIDINMGCPARNVAHRGAGVGLMRTPLKVARIVRKLAGKIKVPVTAKMRIGWDDCRSYPLIARIVEEEGGALIAIHGRTKQQGYGGEAEWEAIAKVKAAVKIPVIGNGDIKKVADIQRMKDVTGCDAVMIGRAAVYNPWLFSRLDREQVSPEKLREIMHLHLEKNIQFYGAEDGQRLFRKYAISYLLLKNLDRETRKNILRKRPTGEFVALLDELYASMDIISI